MKPIIAVALVAVALVAALTGCETEADRAVIEHLKHNVDRAAAAFDAAEADYAAALDAGSSAAIDKADAARNAASAAFLAAVTDWCEAEGY